MPNGAPPEDMIRDVRGGLMRTLVGLAAVVIAMAGTFGGGFASGARSKAAAVEKALAERDKQDQLAAARAYLSAAARADWNTFVSAASGYIWYPRVFQSRLGVSGYANQAYQLHRIRRELSGVSDLRIGPAISRRFLESAGPFVLSGTFARLAGTGQWPDWKRPPRAVTYRWGNKRYFIVVVRENGGWHALGPPLFSRAEWLKYDDYYEAMEAGHVVK